MRKLVVFFVLLAVPAAAQQRKFDWTPTVTVLAGASFDTATTHYCGGERNPFFQKGGDWTRPDYVKMWSLNAVSAAATYGVTKLTHRARLQSPSSKTARVLDYSLRGLFIAAGARRGWQGVVNLDRCIGR